ncbi:MAG: hypothetical protein LBQ22_09675, partial [Bacteroidales bacterium]|nr:hypothetical protein [Bacteroidales bacterium]
MKTFFTFIVLMLLLSLSAASQTYTLNSSLNNQTITTCGGTMYDSGGPTGNYGHNENYTVTICSDNGGTLELNFTTFYLESPTWDNMSIYDGPSSYGYPALVANAGNRTLQGETISSTGTCVTIVWHTDGSMSYDGFAMNISCRFPCQEVEIGSLITDPPYYEGEDGYSYIDICQGESITVTATGVYPENNTNYAQSDATSTFTWNFGEGDLLDGSTVSYIYEGIRGYELGLMLRDIQNCSTGMRNTDIRIRVSTTPVFQNISLGPDILCPGETLYLSGFAPNGGLPGHNIEPVPSHMTYGLSRADTVFLPDGSGVTYNSPLTFSNFSPDATVTSIDDILSICTNMEHSYMGDLSMRLRCPNGTEVQFFSQGGGGTVLGEPVASGLPVDSNTSNITPGVGYDYCWSPTSTSGTIHQSTNWNQISNYVDRIGQTSTGTINQLRPGTYQISGNWSSFIGCPLNGTWTIFITDHLGADNGYIFSWGIELREDLYPTGWEYAPVITENDCVWEGNNVQGNLAYPDTPGVLDYTFTVTDNFGCAYDTTLQVTVRDFDDPICCSTPVADAGDDAQVCGYTHTLNARMQPNNTGSWQVITSSIPSGARVPTFANPNSPNATVTVYEEGIYQFEWTEMDRFPSCSNSDIVTIEFRPIPTSTFSYTPILCYGESTTVTYTGNVGASATFNWNFSNGIIESGSGIGPYRVRWANAGIHSIRLQVNYHYCSSTETISNLDVPSLLSFNVITTDDPCFQSCGGIAELVIQGGRLPYTYSWTSPTNVLDNLCANDYTVTVTDNNGCTASKPFSISEPNELVIAASSSTNLSCYNSFDGDISITVAGGTGNISYIWSDIGAGMSERTGLAAGNYQVTAIDANGCSVSEQFTLTQPNQLSVTISPDIAICETTQAVIQAQAMGGTPQYTYYWDMSNGSGFAPNNSTLILTPDTTTRYFV